MADITAYSRRRVPAAGRRRPDVFNWRRTLMLTANLALWSALLAAALGGIFHG